MIHLEVTPPVHSALSTMQPLPPVITATVQYHVALLHNPESHNDREVTLAERKAPLKLKNPQGPHGEIANDEFRTALTRVMLHSFH